MKRTHFNNPDNIRTTMKNDNLAQQIALGSIREMSDLRKRRVVMNSYEPAEVAELVSSMVVRKSIARGALIAIGREIEECNSHGTNTDNGDRERAIRRITKIVVEAMELSK